MLDFTPTKETISLHGLGFMQIIVPAGRLHIWHPDLPRRKCFEQSKIHNHRFSFRSTVLKGKQHNVRCKVIVANDDGITSNATHNIISHNGPRSELGSRLSYIDGTCRIEEKDLEIHPAGTTYFMDVGEYHYTPCDGIVITFMQKLAETKDFHANSIIELGHEFDQRFNRFQLSPDEMWRLAVDAFEAN